MYRILFLLLVCYGFKCTMIPLLLIYCKTYYLVDHWQNNQSGIYVRDYLCFKEVMLQLLSAIHLLTWSYVVFVWIHTYYYANRILYPRQKLQKAHYKLQCNITPFSICFTYVTPTTWHVADICNQWCMHLF